MVNAKIESILKPTQVLFHSIKDLAVAIKEGDEMFTDYHKENAKRMVAELLNALDNLETEF